MSKKSFRDSVTELLAAETAGGKKPKKTFSKNLFTSVSTAMLNDPDYEFTKIQVKNGVGIPVETTPVRDFRKQFLGPIFKEIGKMDDDDLRVALEEYQFSEKQVDSLYALNDCILQEYLGLGRKYRFQNTEDFCAGIHIREAVDKKDSKRKYKALVKKSICPLW